MSQYYQVNALSELPEVKVAEDEYFASFRANFTDNAIYDAKNKSRDEELIINISRCILKHIKAKKLESDFRNWTEFDTKRFQAYVGENCCCNPYSLIPLLTCCIGCVWYSYNNKRFEGKYEFPAPTDYYGGEYHYYGTKDLKNIAKNHWKYLKLWEADSICEILGCKNKYKISTTELGLVNISQGYERYMFDFITAYIERIQITVYNMLKYENIEL